MEARQSLLHPLLPTINTSSNSPATSAASSSTSTPTVLRHHTTNGRDGSSFLSDYGILTRLLSVLLIGMMSLWANHEASKGFNITIINDAEDSLAGKHFSLFYVSNDKATRIILHASKFCESFLYPAQHDDVPKKLVHHVTLKLVNSTQKLLDMGMVSHSPNNEHDFVIHLSPLVFKEDDVNRAMVGVIRHSMAWIWLWDGWNSAPATLVAGMVKYMDMLADSSGDDDDVVEYSAELEWPETCQDRQNVDWWEDKDPAVVAHFLHNFERQQNGFIRRLNREMKSKWHNRMVKDAVGTVSDDDRVRTCGCCNTSSDFVGL